jgi:hypothetical protein
MPLPIPRRRTLAKIGLFLLAGAVVNVGVGWGCLAVESAVTYANGIGFERTTASWAYSKPPGWPAAPVNRTARDAPGVTWRWDTFVSEQPDGGASAGAGLGSVRHAIGVRAGVPFRSIQSIAFADESVGAAGPPTGFPPFEYIGGWPLSSTEPWLMAPYAVLPLGFAANTLVFALLLFAVVEAIRRGAGTLRRRLRRARGLCPRCKYAIADLPTCPECGETIRRKAATP